MATITSLAQSATSTTSSTRQWVEVPSVYKNVIDFAAAATAKGSALAAADVIEAIRLPAGSIVMQAGILVVTVAEGESADVALDLGITGVDADQWVDGFDYDAAAAGDRATPVAGDTTDPMRYTAASDTIDVLIQAATTAPTAGKIMVWALVLAPPALDEVGLAQVGD